MNILFLTSSLGSGGAERVATTLANAWAKRGDKVTLVPTFSGGGHPFYEVSQLVELVYLADAVGSKSKSPVGYVTRLMALRQMLYEKRPDVVIAFLPNVNIAAIVASFGFSTPVIICERRDPFSQPCSKLWELACRLLYRCADMLTVQTVPLASTIGEIYGGVKRIRAVPNPLPDPIVTTAKETACCNRKVLLSLCRLSSEKQVEMAITAFSSLTSRFVDWDFHIYGEGPCRDAIESHIDALGLQGRVFLFGRTTDPWGVMAAADAFLMTSKYEGFPNALLEAMGVGLACVVLDCPSGPREITQDGEYAVLVAPNNLRALVESLERTMCDDFFRFDLGQRARESILRRYRLSAVLDKWDDLFREVGATN